MKKSKSLLNKPRKIYCCECEKKVHARLTNGREIYPSRADLHGLPFWKCDACGNYVGCHHKAKNKTHPLGVIPTPPLRRWRSKIHAVLDPLWKDRLISRTQAYNEIARRLGLDVFHTANIRTVDEAKEVYDIAVLLQQELSKEE